MMQQSPFQPRRMVVAMDSFKGSLTSAEAGESVGRGVRRRWPDAGVTVLTVSDGGEGWLDACRAAMGGEVVGVAVSDPLLRTVGARYLLSGHTAVIEVAQACGLMLVRPEERRPLQATSRGVGQMVAHAIGRGARSMLVGLGGTATSDAGRGFAEAMAEAFGERWWESEAVRRVRFTIATDVRAPLCGEQGAARVFAPQKGATPAEVVELERQAAAFAAVSARLTGRDSSRVPGAGAAGGLGYVFMQYLNAHCRMGLDVLWEAYGGDALLRQTSLLITGEGAADAQTLMGKLPHALLRHAMPQDVPVWLLAGKVEQADRLLAAGFDRVACIHRHPLPLAEAMRPDVACRALEECVCHIC